VFSIYADTPVSVDIVHDQIPGVRLTLLAKSVEVADYYLAGANLPHDDGDDSASEPGEPREPAAA
jgi:hypothetical protein